MAEESFQEKTEKATPKKREETRKKGEVAKSRELPSVAVLLTGLFTLTFFGAHIYNRILMNMERIFTHLTVSDISVPDFILFAQQMIQDLILMLAPFFGAIVLAAVFSNVLQVGFMLSGEAIKPKISKLDPIKGFGRLFSKHALMELAKSLLKLAIVSIVAYYTIKGEMGNTVLYGDMELNGIASHTLYTTFKIFLKCTLAMVILAVLDYAFQRWDFENRIKMSKQEIKDEFKRTEGDPLVKSRIRSIQMEMARKRMMQDVPKADVVITNPTHIAVAIKYDSLTMGAPKLLAKGAGSIAERIKSVAKEHDIPVVENKEVARSVYKLVEIGQEIPVLLYQAVAEVLAYIYKLKGRHTSKLA